MAKRKTNPETEVIKVDGEVVETVTEDVSEETEVETEIVEEPVKEESKKKGAFKKALPYILGGGAVLAAFFMGRKSSNKDDLYLAKLEDEYNDGEDEDESEESVDDDTDDTSDEE